MHSNVLTTAALCLSWSLVSHAAPPDAFAYNATVVHQFPNGTWIENLALRSTGGILATMFIPNAQVVYLDPSCDNPTPQVVASFPSPATGVAGITELDPDIFYVATLGIDVSSFTTVAASSQLWRLDLRQWDRTAQVETTLVANITRAELPNGVTALAASQKVLVADSTLGVIWRVDPISHLVDVAINSTVLTRGNSTVGVNGIHARGHHLYYVNTAQATYGRIPIDEHGNQVGKAEVLFQDAAHSFDDFALVPFAGHNAIIAADPGNNATTLVHGDQRDQFTYIAKIDGPTAVQVGRSPGDEKSLYVSSTGDDGAFYSALAQGVPVPVGGRISKIELAPAS